MRIEEGPLKKVMLCLVSCLFTLSFLEIALRLYGYDLLRELRTGRVMMLKPSALPILKYELSPGASGWAWGANVTINSQGFRGPESTPGEYPGYRILILGDSIAFGFGLAVEDTFAYQLQQLLLSENREFEVLNLAVGGYDTVQEVALLQYRGREYNPDLVVLAYCLNDAGIASANLDFIENLRASPESPIFHLRLIQFVAEKLDRIRQKRWTTYKNSQAVFRREHAQEIDTIGEDETGLLALMAAIPDIHPSRWYGDRDRVGRLRFAFRWLRQLSREDNFSVLVMLIPWLVGDAERYPHVIAHRIVKFEARGSGFDTIDLTRPFMHTGVESLRISPRDAVHPNEAGHSIIADKLSKYVSAQAK